MDMFMDKLAQKLTAQEIIKANTTAEAEDLNRLRNQIDEYDRCLAKLKQLLEESADKLKGNSDQNEQLQKLLAERLGNVEANLGERFGNVDTILGERLGGMDAVLGQRLGDMNNALEQRLGDMNSALEQRLGDMNRALEQRFSDLDQSMDAKLGQLDSKIDEGEDTHLEEKLLSITESVHKECVKVYRNVQAVIVEEGSKQSELLNGVTSSAQRLGKKLNIVFGISLASLVLSLISVVVQLLNMFHLF
ncbi:MAG: hypothetical protein J1E01_10075 [Acetatifactor sp.]|nr:hypothetical protein [Acetatifactor sp.]